MKKKDLTHILTNKIVVVGEDGINTLGILREFGEWNIYPEIIMLQKQIYSKYLVKKSKYSREVKIIEFDDFAETKLIEHLKQKYKNNKEKAILLTTTDTACELIDKHVEELEPYFLLSTISGKTNGITHYLDKYNAYCDLTKVGGELAKTVIVDLSEPQDKKIIKSYSIPCILKPRESAHGVKSDIEFCYTEDELMNGLKKFKRLKYKNLILQELLDYEYEFDMHGYITPNHMYVPGVMKYLHKQLIGTNDYAFMQYIPLDLFEAKEYINQLFKILKKVGYVGSFAAEAFYSNGKVYINEINWRTDDGSYNEVYSGHYILVEYALSLIGKDPKIVRDEKKNKKPYYISFSFEAFHLWKKKKLSTFRLIKEIVISKSHTVFLLKDMKPFFVRAERWLKK